LPKENPIAISLSLCCTGKLLQFLVLVGQGKWGFAPL